MGFDKTISKFSFKKEKNKMNEKKSLYNKIHGGQNYIRCDVYIDTSNTYFIIKFHMGTTT